MTNHRIKEIHSDIRYPLKIDRNHEQYITGNDVLDVLRDFGCFEYGNSSSLKKLNEELKECILKRNNKMKFVKRKKSSESKNYYSKFYY